MKNNVIIVGGFIEIIELCEANNFNIIGIIDNNKLLNLHHYSILGNDEDAEDLFAKFPNILIILSPDSPKIRKTLENRYHECGFKFQSLVSKHASISKSANIGLGSVIQTGVNISAEANIGKFVKINSYANIMHNASIGDYTTIAPNAVILGFVKIGKNCYIGSNATILPYIEICDDVIIGAGAVVTKNIETPSTYIGVPARMLKK